MRPLFLGIDGRVRRGVRRVVSQSASPVASDWAISVPGGVEWKLLTGTAALVLDATVGNRFIQAQLAVEGTTVWRSTGFGAFAAGQVVTLSLTGTDNAAQTATNNNPVVIGVPHIWLPSGAQIVGHFNPIGAADAWGPITLYVEEIYTTDQQRSIERDEREQNRAAADAALLAAIGTPTP